jgi:hypothetical protein
MRQEISEQGQRSVINYEVDRRRTVAGSRNSCGYTAITIAFLLLCCIHAHGAEVKLAWDAPSGGAVTGYKVYRGVSARVYDNVALVGIQPAYIATGISAGTYYFAVTAIDDQARESDFSAEVSITLTDASTTTSSTTSTSTTVKSSTTTSTSTTTTKQITTTTTIRNRINRRYLFLPHVSGI